MGRYYSYTTLATTLGLPSVQKLGALVASQGLALDRCAEGFMICRLKSPHASKVIPSPVDPVYFKEMAHELQYLDAIRGC